MSAEVKAQGAPMHERTYSRAAGASGLVFVVAMFGALFAPGQPPRASDSAASIASGLADDRGVILVATWVGGFGLIAAIWFFCGVAGWLGDGSRPGERSVVNAGAAAGIAGVLLTLVGLLLFYGASYEVAGAHQLGVVRGLTDAGNATIEMGKFGIAAFIAGTCAIGLRSGRLGRGLARAGQISAAVALASSIALFAEGSFTEFGGTLDLIGGVPAIVWLVALSARMLRGTPA
jgi:hypothetical protein